MSAQVNDIRDTKILYNLAVFGIPTVLSYILALVHIFRLRGDVVFLGRWLVLQQYPFTMDHVSLAAWAKGSYIFMLFNLALPVILLICWAVAAFVNFPLLYGYTIIFLGLAFYLSMWAFVRWYVPHIPILFFNLPSFYLCCLFFLVVSLPSFTC